MLLFSYFLLIVTCIYVIVILFFLIGLYFPSESRGHRIYSVSVIVAARNEEENIYQCLSDLVRQTYPVEHYEVVVVDDHSSDTTSEIVRRFVEKYPQVRLLPAKAATDGLTPKKNAINQGIQNSTGEIILTTDADCRVKPTWIETMISYFDEDVGMVVGFSQFGRKAQRLSLFETLQALDFLSLMTAAAGSCNLGFPLAASGQNLAYRRVAFEQVGGFAPIGHRVSGDDVLLLQLVHRKTRWKIRFAASEKAHNSTQAEKNLKSFINQRRRWASNGPYQFRLNKPFFMFLMIVFGVNLGLLLSVPWCLLTTGTGTIPLFCLSAKAIVEFLITLKGARIFNRPELLKYFLVWFFLQIPYVVVAGLLGSFGHFTWKGRKH